MIAATKLLDSLPRVKQLRQNVYTSGCPAHGSREGRPVHITVTDDGVLIHAFCGCATGDVLAAVGLGLRDLFDKPVGDSNPTHNRIPARDLLEVIDLEALTVSLLALEFKNAKQLSDGDWQRLATASARIGRARDHAHGR